MPAIIEHWSEISSVVLTIVMLTIAWQKFRARHDALEKTVKTNDAVLTNRLNRLEQETEQTTAEIKKKTEIESERVTNLIQDGFRTCHVERTGMAKQMFDHHENDRRHITENERNLQQEWRETVLRRFDKLEDLIIKTNGGT